MMGSCFRTYSKVALSCWFDFSRQNPFQLIVALSSTDEARGGLFYDDGESLGKRWPALKNKNIPPCLLYTAVHSELSTKT